MSDLGPPWIIFADRGKSVAILPAGRPGEVADVHLLPDEQVRAIVDAANSGERGAFARLESLTERVLAMRDEGTGRDQLRAALRRLTDALCSYVNLKGLEHDDPCPEDDTCECVVQQALSEALDSALLLLDGGK